MFFFPLDPFEDKPEARGAATAHAAKDKDLNAGSADGGPPAAMPPNPLEQQVSAALAGLDAAAPAPSSDVVQGVMDGTIPLSLLLILHSPFICLR